jgi:hypothetical protein
VARFLVVGFDGFRLKIDENYRKYEMTLVLKLNYLRFSVSRKITMPSQGGYFRDSTLSSGASCIQLKEKAEFICKLNMVDLSHESTRSSIWIQPP